MFFFFSFVRLKFPSLLLFRLQTSNPTKRESHPIHLAYLSHATSDWSSSVHNYPCVRTRRSSVIKDKKKKKSARVNNDICVFTILVDMPSLTARSK